MGDFPGDVDRDRGKLVPGGLVNSSPESVVRRTAWSADPDTYFSLCSNRRGEESCAGGENHALAGDGVVRIGRCRRVWAHIGENLCQSLDRKVRSGLDQRIPIR